MSETKHTKGPWHCTKKHPRQISDARGFKIAKCLRLTKGSNFSMPEEEAQANAHLIAAAPELLEALKAVLDSLFESGRRDFEAEQRAEDAIAKAEGRSQGGEDE